MDKSNHDIVHMLTQQIDTILTLMIVNNNVLGMMVAQQFRKLNMVLVDDPNQPADAQGNIGVEKA